MHARSLFCVLILAVLAQLDLSAMELFVAPLVLQDETGGAALSQHPDVDRVQSLGDMLTAEVLAVQRSNEPSGGSVRSFLDAARLCESQGYGYLLYGFVKSSPYSLYAEVKLLDAEKNEVAASFFNSDDRDHYDRLMRDLAARIVDYFYVDVGLKSVEKKPPARNLVSFPLSLGYWTPASGNWNPVLSGLGSVTLGFRFTPVSPLFKVASREGEVSFGLDAEYALGMNQPSYESFFLHSLRFRMPAEVNVRLGKGHNLGFDAGPLLQIDMMSQDRRFAPTYADTSATGGISIAAQYSYTASRMVAVGFSTVIDIAMYAQPLVTVSPRLFVRLSPWSPVEE